MIYEASARSVPEASTPRPSSLIWDGQRPAIMTDLTTSVVKASTYVGVVAARSRSPTRALSCADDWQLETNIRPSWGSLTKCRRDRPHAATGWFQHGSRHCAS
jgi:hypothetical protein